jgi:hypothetical protein
MGKFIASLDEQFRSGHRLSLALLERIPPDKLYWQPVASSAPTPVYSCGEYVLRSAGVVEQTFGGITTNLWDDPFEWTLPETLSTNALIAEYLGEVEATRKHAFDSFKGDEDLLKEIALPSGDAQMIHMLLLSTLARSAHFQGRAFATFSLFSSSSLPRV